MKTHEERVTAVTIEAATDAEVFRAAADYLEEHPLQHLASISVGDDSDGGQVSHTLYLDRQRQPRPVAVTADGEEGATG